MIMLCFVVYKRVMTWLCFVTVYDYEDSQFLLESLWTFKHLNRMKLVTDVLIADSSSSVTTYYFSSLHYLTTSVSSFISPPLFHRCATNSSHHKLPVIQARTGTRFSVLVGLSARIPTRHLTLLSRPMIPPR